MKLLYLCDTLNCHAAGKTGIKKRPTGNRIHRSLPNTELRQITSVYMLTIYLTNIHFNLLASHIDAYYLLSHNH